MMRLPYAAFFEDGTNRSATKRLLGRLYMFQNPASFCCCLFITSLFWISNAGAQFTVYTSEAAFLAAINGLTRNTEDFELTPLGDLPINASTDIGLFNIFVGYPFHGGDDSIYEPGAINGTREFGGYLEDPMADVLRFDFDSPIVGFAGNFVSTATSDLLTVNVNGHILVFDDFLPGSGDGFLGVTDLSSPFTSINFGVVDWSLDGEFFRLDNFSIVFNPPIGDVNLDGTVNLQDVGPFIDLILSGKFQSEADINQDGFVNLSDVQPFIELLLGN